MYSVTVDHGSLGRVQPVLFCTACLVVVLAPIVASAKWDRIMEVSSTVRIDTRSDRIRIDLPLRDHSGEQKYLLWCEGGSERYLDGLSDATGINYVGPLMCALNEGDKRTESSLLAEDDVGPWHTRGQFRWEQLSGACGRYPEYGRIRHFRLRGIILTLEAANLVLANGELAAFDLKISVRNDPTAISSTAAQAGFLPPEGSCSVIRLGNESRTCRNWAAGGRYVRCPDPHTSGE